MFMGFLGVHHAAHTRHDYKPLLSDKVHRADSAHVIKSA